MPGPAMREAFAKDSTAMAGMIFGEVPWLDALLANVEHLE